MIKILDIKEEIIKDVLDFLYTDEVMNVLTIHYFENKIEQIGDLYVSYKNELIDALLHIKDDGNSHFTTFYALTTSGLEAIADQIMHIDYPDLLLAGKDDDVTFIMNHMKKTGDLYMNTYYVHQSMRPIVLDQSYTYKAAEEDEVDLLKGFIIDFFGAQTDEVKNRITADIKLDDIRLLYLNDAAVGYGRFFGHSKNYIDIASVYISPQHRGKGYSKVLMTYLIDEAMGRNKIPILQAGHVNEAANRSYRSVGFEQQCNYVFQFINR